MIRRFAKPGMWIGPVALAVALSFAIKALLAWRTYGTNDVLTWEDDLEQIRQIGAIALYRTGVHLHGSHLIYMPFNHPPFMTNVLRFWGWLSEVSQLPLRFWMRLSCAVADVVSAVLLMNIMQHSQPGFRVGMALMMILAPASLLISGFHGNTDPIMMMFLVLCVYFMEVHYIPWWAGIAFGMAMSVKIVPLIFIFAILLFLNGARDRLQFLGAAVVVFILGSIPIIIQAPALVMSSVFGYKSLFGYWGFSLIATGMRDGPAHWLFELYSAAGRPVLFVVIAAASIYMNTASVRMAPIRQLALISFLFLALTPGFGNQYLVWLIPWTVMLDMPTALAFHVTSGFFLFTSYNYAAGGYPWYLADSTRIPPGGMQLLAGIPCWLTVCYIALVWLTGVSVEPSVHTGRPNATGLSEPDGLTLP